MSWWADLLKLLGYGAEVVVNDQQKKKDQDKQMDQDIANAEKNRPPDPQQPPS